MLGTWYVKPFRMQQCSVLFLPETGLWVRIFENGGLSVNALVAPQTCQLVFVALSCTWETL